VGKIFSKKPLPTAANHSWAEVVFSPGNKKV